MRPHFSLRRFDRPSGSQSVGRSVGRSVRSAFELLLPGVAIARRSLKSQELKTGICSNTDQS